MDQSQHSLKARNADPLPKESDLIRRIHYEKDKMLTRADRGASKLFLLDRF